MIGSDLDPLGRQSQTCLYHKNNASIITSTGAHALTLRYVRTVKSPLVEPYDIDAYVITLAHDSLPAT